MRHVKGAWPGQKRRDDDHASAKPSADVRPAPSGEAWIGTDWACDKHPAAFRVPRSRMRFSLPRCKACSRNVVGPLAANRQHSNWLRFSLLAIQPPPFAFLRPTVNRVLAASLDASLCGFIRVRTLRFYLRARGKPCFLLSKFKTSVLRDWGYSEWKLSFESWSWGLECGSRVSLAGMFLDLLERVQQSKKFETDFCIKLWTTVAVFLANRSKNECILLSYLSISTSTK